MKRNKLLLFIQWHVWKQLVNPLLHVMPPDVALAHGIQKKRSPTVAVSLLASHSLLRLSEVIKGTRVAHDGELCSPTPLITAVPFVLPLIVFSLLLKFL